MSGVPLVVVSAVFGAATVVMGWVLVCRARAWDRHVDEAQALSRSFWDDEFDAITARLRAER